MLTEGVQREALKRVREEAEQGVLHMKGSPTLRSIVAYIDLLKAHEMAHMVNEESEARMRRHQGALQVLGTVGELFAHEPVVTRRAASRREV